MIYLCAQPDDFYFTWQLEVLIFNYNSLGISPQDIHILIGYDPKSGLKYFFRELIQRNEGKASFYTYPDKRKSKNYIPSIRPHIIAEHIKLHPQLASEAIFYHDSDIILTSLPDFNAMLNDDTWYVSDTREYLDSHYIKLVADETLFNDMCRAMRVTPELVEGNDHNCGGAQYLLKRTSAKFWTGVERDTETLFTLMQDYNNRLYLKAYEKKPIKRSQFRSGIQAWCADMWVIFWRALSLGKKVEIHKELDFLVAKSLTEELSTKKIFHYSGDAIEAAGPVFRKIKYTLFPPFHDARLSKITNETVSYYLVNYLKQFKSKTDEQRIDLSDVTFIIPIKIDSESRLENLYAITGYLDKFFKTNILIGEVDSIPRVDALMLPDCCQYHFFEDHSEIMHRTRLNNLLIKQAQTPILSIYDTDVVFQISQITSSVEEIRKEKFAIVSPYDGSFKTVTNLLKPIFLQILDPLLLDFNAEIFPAASKRSYGGAIFLNRDIYIKAGMDNEFFTSWGPEDIERVKRMRLLGYKTKRIPGNLFHLPHDRKTNSGYNDTGTYENFIEEYIKISNLNASDLQAYIQTW